MESQPQNAEFRNNSENFHFWVKVFFPSWTRYLDFGQTHFFPHTLYASNRARLGIYLFTIMNASDRARLSIYLPKKEKKTF